MVSGSDRGFLLHLQVDSSVNALTSGLRIQPCLPLDFSLLTLPFFVRSPCRTEGYITRREAESQGKFKGGTILCLEGIQPLDDTYSSTSGPTPSSLPEPFQTSHLTLTHSLQVIPTSLDLHPQW